MPIAGQTLPGGLKLIRLIGRGSHGLVYFGVSREGQPRAVKIFPKHFAPLMEREYEHALDLIHPRLSTVLEKTTLGEQPALICQYAKGVTLFERYKQRPTLQHERQAFLLTLAHVLEGLGYMHQRGLVHCDVKPDNIIVEADGSAKLIDYDLSGPLNSGPERPTQIGTPAFLSPEGERGEALGPESDLYSVGVLLGWGLYGQLLEPGETVQPLLDPLIPLWQALTHPDRTQRPQRALAVREQLLDLADEWKMVNG